MNWMIDTRRLTKSFGPTRALDRLGRSDRSLLLLVYLDELPLVRVGELLDTPVTTLRRRIARALERFKVAVERERRGHGLPRRS